MNVTYTAVEVGLQAGMFLLALLTFVVTLILAFRSHK
ncbi:putative holin-like toxin (plasmid) [Alicyclobacillus fastidiosus]|uniref:Holin-like toxin n=1 Tax=Alicyclobacillus fastidiosus TaxID=392011 RepID=A0ABY6ZQ06_9BACL|nr:putative holin-like toxin [Alicyclobacillus fastidiosus]WAH44922.1 putative holin-like toxin [Alicyclobacillus fastidiosus]